MRRLRADQHHVPALQLAATRRPEIEVRARDLEVQLQRMPQAKYLDELVAGGRERIEFVAHPSRGV